MPNPQSPIPNPQPQRYFARVTAGLEQLAWHDIERRDVARLIGFGHRRIDFAYAGTPAALLDLRSVDDIYVYAARLTGLDHTRASLGRLAAKIVPIDLLAAVEVCAAVRSITAAPTYRVTASHLGRRNYSRYDIESAVATALTGNLPWRFVLNDADQEEPELDLRVLLEDDWALLGLRLGALPLHRRAYKVASRPGSLKPPVAYCMGLLAALAPDVVVLDPACGAGTILVEAAAFAPSGIICGGDLDIVALETAHENLQAAGIHAMIIDLSAGFDARKFDITDHSGQPTALLYQGDAAEVRLADHSVDAVLSNLPWGKQVMPEIDLAALYLGILNMIERALVPGGRAVLLTDQAEQLQAALAACPALHMASAIQISLYGRHPTLYVLHSTAI
jgi:tRNA (guanine6-N2)-methyltransferase